MNDENSIDPGHSGMRDLCRIAGPIILGIGILMIVKGKLAACHSRESGNPVR